MNPVERITELAQQIYLGRNQERNDVTGSEFETFIDNTISWVNQYLPELDKEAYWSWVRENDYRIANASAVPKPKYDIDEEIRTVVIDYDRPVYLEKGGRVIATFDVVSPNLLRNARQQSSENRCAVVGRQLVFSRAFTENEIGATIYADVVNYLPKLSRTNTEVLDLVDPVQLIVLGVLKNQTLPDIVQGGLSPSFAQKYADLLEGAKELNDMTSQDADASIDDMSGIRGVW